MAEFKADEYLGDALSPFDDWSSLVVLLCGHAKLLKHSLVGLLTLGYDLEETSVVEVIVVVDLEEAVQRLRKQLQLVC